MKHERAWSSVWCSQADFGSVYEINVCLKRIHGHGRFNEKNWIKYQIASSALRAEPIRNRPRGVHTRTMKSPQRATAPILNSYWLLSYTRWVMRSTSSSNIDLFTKRFSRVVRWCCTSQSFHFSRAGLVEVLFLSPPTHPCVDKKEPHSSQYSHYLATLLGQFKSRGSLCSDVKYCTNFR